MDTLTIPGNLSGHIGKLAWEMEGQSDVLWIQLIGGTFVSYLVLLNQWIQLKVFKGLPQHHIPFIMLSDYSDLFLKPQKT